MIRTEIINVALYKEDLELVVNAVRDATAQLASGVTHVEKVVSMRTYEDLERLVDYLEKYLPKVERLGGFTS